MVDIAVKSGAAWTCQGHQLSDVLLTVHISDEEDDEEELSQPGGDETNCCCRWAAEAVCRVIVGLRALQPRAAPCGAGSIDMQQVQSLVEEMGTSLSPGAQSLMEMVHFQQKNQTSSLGGFLPLLMGGGLFSALAQGASISPAAASDRPQPAASRPQNGAMSGSATDSSPDLLVSGVETKVAASGESGGPAGHAHSQGHAHLAEVMSHLLKGHGQAVTSGPELLPALQSLCGQVTKLRLDDSAALAEKEKMMKTMMRNGSWELDSAMERRLEEMERRLKEHLDRRLDALEQKLETALLAALPLAALHQAAASSSAGGGGASESSPGPLEQTAPPDSRLALSPRPLKRPEPFSSLHTGPRCGRGSRAGRWQ